MNFKNSKLLVVSSLAMGAAFAGALQPPMLSPSSNPMVGGMAMMKTKNIVENAVSSADHTTLVAAVKAAGLVDVLMSKGPFTVFAPVNEAFARLPAGTVDTLLQPENKDALKKVLTYHVVPGRIDSLELKRRIKQGMGKATLRTVSGGTLLATMNGQTNIVIQDEKGGVASISTYDVYQSNGVIHVVNRVLMPN